MLYFVSKLLIIILIVIVVVSTAQQQLIKRGRRKKRKGKREEGLKFACKSDVAPPGFFSLVFSTPQKMLYRAHCEDAAACMAVYIYILYIYAAYATS